MRKKNKSSQRTSESRSLRAKLSVSAEPSAESEQWSFFADVSLGKFEEVGRILVPLEPLDEIDRVSTSDNSTPSGAN